MSGQRVYRCSPSIVWARDVEQTLVVDRETGRSWALRGAEAVAWSLLASGYSYRKIISMLSLILSLPAEEAGRALAGMLREWRDAGIVCVAGGEGDG